MLNFAADNPVQWGVFQCVFIEFVMMILELVEVFVIILTWSCIIVANLKSTNWLSEEGPVSRSEWFKQEH